MDKMISLNDEAKLLRLFLVEIKIIL